MELIISQNRVIETKEVSSELINNSVIYKGLSLEWDEINIYDTEGGKIAPYVRYLLEGEQKGKSKIVFYAIISIIILILLLWLVFLFSSKETKSNNQNIPWISSNIQSLPVPINKDEIKNEILNEIKKNETTIHDAANDNNNEALSLESQKAIFQLESNYMVLENSNNILINKNISLAEQNEILFLESEKLKKDIIWYKEQIESLKNDLVKKSERENKQPNDEFIYFLWEYLYKNCELSDNTIKDKCKEIYYNFLKK